MVIHSQARNKLSARKLLNLAVQARRSRPALAAAVVMLSVVTPTHATAQVLSNNLEPRLIAINSGDITVNGDIYNPTINGGEKNSITLTAEGAVIYFDSKSLLQAIEADPGMPIQASANSYSVTNTGIVSSRGNFAGQTPVADQLGNVTVSAVGLQAGVMISSVPRN